MNRRLSRIASILVASTCLTLFNQPAGWATTDAGYADIARSTSLSGAYLAAQIASRTNDDTAAVAFFAHSLRLDPDNEELRRLYFLALTANGRISEAVEIARAIPAGSEQSAVIRLVQSADAMKKKAFAKVLDILKEPEGGDLDQLVERITAAWAAFGNGDAKGALAAIGEAQGADWVAVVASYHAGLISAASGDDKSAIQALEQAVENRAAAQVLPETYLRSIEALVRAYARSGEFDKARETLQKGIELVPKHPPFLALVAPLAESKPLTPLIASAPAGAAEILYNIGAAISRQGGGPFAQGYMQIADHLAPGSDVITMALGQIFEGQRQFERANGYYGRIPKESPFWRRAELEHALNLNDLKRVDEARAKLQGLIDSDPDDILSYITMGGVLSQHEKYQEAAAIYDAAVARVPDPGPQDWNLFYRRGIAYERLKQWDKAEPNFKKSLELSPDQADVLNYLGYSWIDQGINLEEGLDLIRKAVELSPRKGYIIDSLGWAYYRLGRYEDAVVELERAVELLPRDPILNDHLGDAYWKVGRKLEATFQWNHALASEPEPEDEKRIREKLKTGLVDTATPTAATSK